MLFLHLGEFNLEVNYYLKTFKGSTMNFHLLMKKNLRINVDESSLFALIKAPTFHYYVVSALLSLLFCYLVGKSPKLPLFMVTKSSRAERFVVSSRSDGELKVKAGH